MQTLPANITPLHVERGVQMRACVQHDIVAKGLTLEESFAALARELGIDVFAVKLAVAIANEYGEEA